MKFDALGPKIPKAVASCGRRGQELLVIPDHRVSQSNAVGNPLAMLYREPPLVQFLIISFVDVVE